MVAQDPVVLCLCPAARTQLVLRRRAFPSPLALFIAIIAIIVFIIVIVVIIVDSHRPRTSDAWQVCIPYGLMAVQLVSI